jgi:hypothetical protein
MSDTSLSRGAAPIKAPTKQRTKATAPPQRTGVERLAWWLDSAFTVPGTRFRFGFDALIGLIPGLGDLVGTLLSSYIVAVAAARGFPPSVLARMAINVGIEAVVGLVPVLGDLFDVAWKANQRNIQLMSRYQSTPRDARRQSRAVVIAWTVGAVVFTVLLGIGAVAVVRWLIDALAGGA